MKFLKKQKTTLPREQPNDKTLLMVARDERVARIGAPEYALRIYHPTEKIHMTIEWDGQIVMSYGVGQDGPVSSDAAVTTRAVTPE